MKFDDFLSHFEIKKRENGRVWCNCPSCEPKDTKNHLCISQVRELDCNKILVKCFKGCDYRSIVRSVGLQEKDLFDNEEVYNESCGELTDEQIHQRNEVYFEFISRLSLNEHHQKHLLARGLRMDQLESIGFRSFDHKSINGFVPEFPVPGWDKVTKKWKLVQGLLIPCLDPQGRIWALKVRSDNGSPKYFWYSTSGQLGKVFAFSGADDTLGIEVVEGVLKSIVRDCLGTRTNNATIGIGGVNSWGSCLEFLKDWRGRKEREVTISFDQDGRQSTGEQVEKFRDKLIELGITPYVNIWDGSKAKGIDDALLAKVPISRVRWGKDDPKPRGLPGSASSQTYGGLNARRASEISPVKINWVVDNWFPRGYLVHISGPPGIGKGLLTSLFASSITRGGRLANELCNSATVGIINREDSADSVITPRLMAAGADRGKVWLVDGSKDGDFSIPKNMDKLEAFIRDSGVDILFIDPLPSFLDPGVEYSVDSSSRPIAVKLGKLARDLNVCICMVFHLTKSGSGAGINRPAGAISWIGESRKAFLMCDDPNPENDTKRYLINTKSNLGRPQGVWELEVQDSFDDRQVQLLSWIGRSKKSEAELLKDRSKR